MSQDLKSLRLLAKRQGINLTNNGKYKTKAMLTSELNKLAIPVQTPVQTPVQISSRPTPSEINIENDEGKKTIHIPPSVNGFTVNIYMTQNNQKEQREQREQKEQKYEQKYEQKEQKESKYDLPSTPPSAPPPPPAQKIPPPPQEKIETPEEKAQRLAQSQKNREEAKARLEQQTKQAKSAMDFLSSLKEATAKQKMKLEGKGLSIKRR
jgi:hypothetical protein